MSDRRRKNANWYTADANGSAYGEIHMGSLLAVAMDIRDELQELNTLMHCHNTMAIPELLRAIKRNTTKPKKRVRKS